MTTPRAEAAGAWQGSNKEGDIVDQMGSRQREHKASKGTDYLNQLMQTSVSLQHLVLELTVDKDVGQLQLDQPNQFAAA